MGGAGRGWAGLWGQTGGALKGGDKTNEKKLQISIKDHKLKSKVKEKVLHAP